MMASIGSKTILVSFLLINIVSTDEPTSLTNGVDLRRDEGVFDSKESESDRPTDLKNGSSPEVTPENDASIGDDGGGANLTLHGEEDATSFSVDADVISSSSSDGSRRRNGVSPNDANNNNDDVDALDDDNKIVRTDKDDTNSTVDKIENDDIDNAVNGTDPSDYYYDPSNETSAINETIPTTNPEEDDNVTLTTTESPTATPSPIIYVDPREFETDLRRCPFSKISSSSSPPSHLESLVKCSDLPVACLNCSYDYACSYGTKTSVVCVVADADIQCQGERKMTKEMVCQYCFQTKFVKEHVCTLRNGPPDEVTGAGGCHVKKSPTSQSRFKSNCTVLPHVLCLGRRTFYKMLPCNWTSGYRWTTALLLSIFLGGFGADRFYLGQWREGIGKLFSFGGLGVWTVIDVILISIGYIGPQDGSLYIY